MELKVGTIFGVCLLGGAFLACSQAAAVTVESSPSSSTPYAMDAKEARAWNIQQEHKKTIILYFISDFENSLYKLNAAKCERQIHQSAAVLSINGVQVTSCQEIIDHRRSADDAHQKLKLSNRVVEITDTDSEARVNVDVMPGGEHHSFTLRQVGKRWFITRFISTVVATQTESKRF